MVFSCSNSSEKSSLGEISKKRRKSPMSVVSTSRISSAMKLSRVIFTLAITSTVLLCLYHALCPYGLPSVTRSAEVSEILHGPGWPPPSESPHLQENDLQMSRWKMRLRKKWDLYYKMKKLQQNDFDYTADMGTQNYVSLSPRALWNVDTLKDYFTEQPVCGEGLLLLIIITSAPQNFDQRLAIRSTWANSSSADPSQEPQSDWRAIFLVGKASTETLDLLIDNEISSHGDVLRGNYTDSYRNLTLKVLHGLHYAATSCRPDYVLKTDDDCFVNRPLMLEFLAQHNLPRHNGLYVGEVLGKAKTRVIRDPESKWHVSLNSYPLERYPPYPSGHGYVISSDLLDNLLNASTRFRPFPNEDAYIGVLMNAIGIRPVNTYRFTLHSYNWRTCNLHYLLVIHHVSPKGQKALWDMALTAPENCPGQTEVTTW